MDFLIPRITQRLQLELRKLARNRRSRLAQQIDKLAVEFHQQFENWNYKLSSNGEARVLEALRMHGGLRVVFDAGANHGQWALLAAKNFPEAAIHAFELSPVVAEALRTHCAAEPRIVVNACGLSDAAGEIEFFYAPGQDVLSSAVAITGGAAREKAKGQVILGAEYCAERGIGQIDLLKIDVEGMEDKVLRGFAPLLEKRAVRVIQFEYGRVNIESHFLLMDAYRFLEGHGFTLGKIYPEGVLFKAYAYEDEDFLGPNYLAVQRTETVLLRRLAGSAHR